LSQSLLYKRSSRQKPLAEGETWLSTDEGPTGIEEVSDEQVISVAFGEDCSDLDLEEAEEEG